MKPVWALMLVIFIGSGVLDAAAEARPGPLPPSSVTQVPDRRHPDPRVSPPTLQLRADCVRMGGRLSLDITHGIPGGRAVVHVEDSVPRGPKLIRSVVIARASLDEQGRLSLPIDIKESLQDVDPNRELELAAGRTYTVVVLVNGGTTNTRSPFTICP